MYTIFYLTGGKSGATQHQVGVPFKLLFHSTMPGFTVPNGDLVRCGRGESSVFGELCPTNCSFLSMSRSSGRGGGFALVFRDTFNYGYFLWGPIPPLKFNA